MLKKASLVLVAGLVLTLTGCDKLGVKNSFESCVEFYTADVKFNNAADTEDQLRAKIGHTVRLYCTGVVK